MNIFALSYNVEECAIWHLDKHIVKMPLETAQMLCTVLNKLGISTPYKPVHAKHPCTLWAGINQSNFRWLSNLGLELCKEYNYRYQKEHACHKVIMECISSTDKLPEGNLTPFAQAMPDEYKNPDPIIAYQNYYKFGKSHIASWKLRSKPAWFA